MILMLVNPHEHHITYVRVEGLRMDFVHKMNNRTLSFKAETDEEQTEFDEFVSMLGGSSGQVDQELGTVVDSPVHDDEFVVFWMTKDEPAKSSKAKARGVKKKVTKAKAKKGK